MVVVLLGNIKKPSTITFYKKLYRLLCEGVCQKNICTILKKDKSQISRMIYRLECGGWVLCINPNERSKIYTATKKPFKINTTKELYKVNTSKSQRLHTRCNIIQIQKARFICDVKKVNKTDCKWDRGWELRNGVSKFKYSYPFDFFNGGCATFIINKEKSLEIWLPRMIWDNRWGNPHSFLLDCANRCANWFMNRFKIELDNLRVCQRPDFSLVLTDPRLIELAQNGTYRFNGIMIDSSSPDNIPEIESKDWDMISGLSSVVPRVDRLERKVFEIKELVVSMKGDLVEIKGFFSVPVRPDSRRDVV